MVKLSSSTGLLLYSKTKGINWTNTGNNYYILTQWQSVNSKLNPGYIQRSEHSWPAYKLPEFCL
jgi:hypothetical protein